MGAPDQILFEEKQYFRQWWLWIFLIGFNLVCLYGTFQQLYLGKAFGSKPVSNEGMVIITGIALLFSYFFASIRLETKVYADRISYRYVPFIFKWRNIPHSEINQAQLRTYRPLAEYGGWGIRISLGKNGTAYTVSGKQGLQLELKNGKKILIGTKKAETLSSTLKMLKSESNHQNQGD